MSVSGLCQLCESRPARERCERCGTLACAAHYERSMGVCVDCADRMRPGETDDVDTYRF